MDKDYIEWQGVKYPLRLTFKAIQKIERETGKSIMLQHSTMMADVATTLSACADISEEEALEMMCSVGIEVVSFTLQTLIINTFDPEKKLVPVAKKPAKVKRVNKMD